MSKKKKNKAGLLNCGLCVMRADGPSFSGQMTTATFGAHLILEHPEWWATHPENVYWRALYD